MYKLVIEDDEGKTTVVPIVRDEITIGRKEGNTIRLTERNVSRRHARLVKDDNAISIEDVASRYGTKFNGEKLQEGRQFREGDIVLIGDYRLSLQMDRAAAQLKDQGSAGATAVAIPAATSVGPAPSEVSTPDFAKLVVVSSNYAGKEFVLSEPEMVIGRTDGHIRIDHRSISRNHAKIVRDGNRYKIVDLRSSNGVRVNGEEYRSVHLKRGDVIELGHVRFRYVDPGENFRFTPDASAPVDLGPAPGGGGFGKVVIGVGLLGVGVLILAVVAVIIVGSGTTTDKPTPPPITSNNNPGTPKVDTPTVPGNDTNDGVAASVGAETLKTIDKHIAAEEWVAAEATIALVRKKHPNDKDLLEKASQVAREKPMKVHFEAGQKRLEKKEWQGAIDSFGEISDVSMYHGRVKSLGLQQKAVDGIVVDAAEAADSAIKRKDVREATKQVELIEKYDPKNDEIRSLRKRINKLRDGRKGKDDVVAAKDPREPKKRDNDKKPAEAKLSKDEARAKRRQLISEARSLGVQGNHSGAISKLKEASKYGGTDHQLLGFNYQKIGNNAAAIKHYNIYLRGHPEGRKSESVRGRIRSLGGTPVN
jgi:ABC transport system ATP-binding/permease protein